MEPVISALSDRYQEKVFFLIVDVEKNNDPSVGKLLKDFKVQLIPTVILMDSQGQMAKRYVGFVSEEELSKEIGKLIK